MKRGIPVMASTAAANKPTMDMRKLRYSPMERRLLKLLAKGKGLTSEDLVEGVYDGDAPFAARHSVNSVMRSLIRKVEHNKEDFIITKTAPNGPYPTEFKKISK